MGTRVGKLMQFDERLR